MAKNFEIVREFDYPVDQAYEAITSDEAIAARYKEYEGLTYEAGRADDGFHALEVNIPIAGNALPPVVTKILKGTLTINRVDRWSPLVDGKATGTFLGKSSGVPSSSEGTYILEPTENGSQLRAIGSVKVKIPLVGGKIEDASMELVSKMLKFECDAAERWVKARS